MQNIINIQALEESLQLITAQHELLDKAKEQLEIFLAYAKEVNIDFSDEGTLDERLKKIEAVLEKFQEIVEKKTPVIAPTAELNKNTKALVSRTNEILAFGGEKDQIEEVHDSMIAKMVEIEREKTKMRIEEIQKKKKNKVPQEYKGILDGAEYKQLEAWTGLKCGDVIFDTDKDDWEEGSCEFPSRVYGRRNVIFLVEDKNENKFGYYFDAKIDEYDEWIKGRNPFLFSLKSNGRVEGMHKFEEKDACLGFLLFGKYDGRLFHMNNGFEVYKLNSVSNAYIWECTSHFDFHDTTKAFNEKISKDQMVRFPQKRVVAIQMN